MGGGLESRCVGRVYCADGAVRLTVRTAHTTYAAALKTTTHPKTRCRKPQAATQHLMLLMMDYVPETCRAKNILIKLRTLFHQVGIPHYFMKKMHGQTTLEHNSC